jgi:3-isopropylmalate/(R)-2-methylmalate dehydratase large subunit
MNNTLYDKIWDSHVVDYNPETDEYLIYIDRHLIHEVTSPQAFYGLRIHHRKLLHPEKILAVADHNIPTKNCDSVEDEDSKLQLETLKANVKEFGIRYFPMGHLNNGIVHVVGPEMGFTLPGTTVVCGDSHTSTHGAFGALAFGIGTSQVEHVFATQTLILKKSKNMKIEVNGKLNKFVTPKDVILYIISQIGTQAGTGYTIEFCGNIFKEMSIEGRMTICNMAIEAGARSGLIAPDAKTISYFKGKRFSPKNENWNTAVVYWQTLYSDEDAIFDKIYEFNAKNIMPQITWGTSPEDSMAIDGIIPEATSKSKEKALEYIGLKSGVKISDVKFDKVFIGSCTNARIEDLRLIADILKIIKDKIGKIPKIHQNIKQALIVPGSGLVKKQAEDEGLAEIFINAGFEWRNPGCSMCLGMNDDKLKPYERCASTSNRNFEGRQGYLGRTHLCSPTVATIIAVCGKINLDFFND